MRRVSRLHSWDVSAYDLLPNRLRLLDRSAEGLHEHTLKTIQKTQWNILGDDETSHALHFRLPCGSLRRSTSANHLRASRLVLGTFSHTTCYPIGFRLLDRSVGQALGILVRVGCTPCGASTPRLSTSSSLRRLTGLLREKLHLRAGFTLRCFQRLSFPDAATQLHGWRHDWYTVGPSTPVLSY